jgi:hypothetical protein
MEFVEFGLMEELEMREWVSVNPSKVKYNDARHESLLRCAAERASPSFVAELVDTYNADVGSCTLAQVTALHMASSAATVSVLLERGAEPAAVTAFGRTPLMYHTRRNL